MTHELKERIHKEKIKCPFCEHEIEALFIPSAVQSSKSSSASAGTKTQWFRSKERYDVLEGCSNCHKTKGEIQKALREGAIGAKPFNKEEHIKKLEELGLADRFKKNAS